MKELLAEDKEIEKEKVKCNLESLFNKRLGFQERKVTKTINHGSTKTMSDRFMI